MATCETCKRELVTVTSTIGDETITLYSCSNCDTRRWEREGQEVDLREVLDLTATATREERAGRRRK